MTDRTSHPHDSNDDTTRDQSPAAAPTLDCTGFRALSSAFVDGQLPTAELREAECHLVDCVACRTLVDRLETIDADLRQMALRYGAAAPLSERVVQSVLNQTTRRDRIVKRWRIAGGTGWAAAAVLALAWFVSSQEDISAFAPAPGDLDGSMSVAIDRSTDGGINGGASQMTLDRPLGSSGGSFGSAAHERYRMGLSQSPLHLADRFSAYHRVGLAATLPALHGQLDWSDLQAECGKGDRCDTPRNGSQRPAAYTTRNKKYDPVIAADPLDASDIDTIFAASLLVDRLAQLEIGDLEELERLRYIVSYDNVIDRLRTTRRRVDAIDRPLIGATQCFFIRVLRGSSEDQVIAEMQSDLSMLELQQKLEDLGHRLERDNSF
jgi:hypothetical protein